MDSTTETKVTEKKTSTKKTAPSSKSKKGKPAKEKALSEKQKTPSKKPKTSGNPKKSASDTPVLSLEAMRRLLKQEFQVQSGRPDVRISDDFVKSVRNALCAELAVHAKQACVMSMYARLKSTDAAAFDLLTMFKWRKMGPIDAILYDNVKVQDAIQFHASQLLLKDAAN